MEIIHIVLGKANPDRMNGVNKVVYQLATEQVISGQNLQVWGITGDLDHNYGKRNFKTKLFLRKKNPFSISKELKAEIRKHKKAIFHVHGGWVPTFWAVTKYLAKHKVKSILTPHGAYNIIAMQRSSFTKKWYFKIFEKHLLDRVQKIHCIGASEKEGLESIYPNNKQLLLPYGFDFTIPEKTTSKEKNSEFTIGFVGRIDIHTKGLDLITEAFSKFHPNKKVRLWIVGDGDQMDELQGKSKALGCFERTTFFGSKFGEDKNKLIRQMDLFLCPSRNEGLPTAVLEAASFGIPSVASKATNVVPFLEKYDAGKGIPNDDARELKKALELFYAKWESDEMSDYYQNAHSMLMKEFSWSKLIPDFQKLYLSA